MQTHKYVLACTGRPIEMSKASRERVIMSTFLIPVIAGLNFVVGAVVTILRIPLYLDTWATSLGVLMGYPVAAIIGGLFYNVIMGLTLWGVPSIVWGLSQVLIALLTFVFYRIGWLKPKQWPKMVVAGLTMGLLNQAMSLPIYYIAFGGLPTPAGGGVLMKGAIFAAVLAATHDHALALFVHNLPLEFVDKTIALFIAVAIFIRLPERLVLTSARPE